VDERGFVHDRTGGDRTVSDVRRLRITADLIRRYSRRGNFHSETSTADELGLPGLVAQGTQVCGPAVGALLDTWGEAVLERGVIEMRFHAMVVSDDEVVATTTFDGPNAAFDVIRAGDERRVASGTAWISDTPLG
jgi:acyl dehydratase